MGRKWVSLLAAIALIGAGCGSGTNNQLLPTPAGSPVTLTVWEVFDDPSFFASLVERYQELRPNIQVEVVEKNFGTYELETANAIAAGIGPDLWAIRNDWLPKHVGKLQAMPEGLLASDPTAETTSNLSNLDYLKQQYPTVVPHDAVASAGVYGIPLSIDTLALYYNQDHFKEVGLTQPPTTWSEFIAAVEKLTTFEANDPTQIVRAGAAIGTAQNINRATDILSLLMLQNHTPMVTEERTSAVFNGALEKTGGGLTNPGTSALEFYTGFANPKKTAYTWNNNLPNSIDAFAQGRVSMMFHYSYIERTLLQKNPTLNYGVAPMPQVDNTPAPVDYPTYWLSVVSRNTQHAAEAWDFLRFLAQEGDVLYQQASGKPPAKASKSVPGPDERILNTDPLSPWIFQATTAETWYRGVNPGRVEQIFGEMIENVVTFKQPHQVAIDNAAAQVTKVLKGNDS